MKIELISDFNLDILVRFLSINKNFQEINASARPFGNLYQSIQTPKSDLNYAFISKLILNLIFLSFNKFNFN